MPVTLIRGLSGSGKTTLAADWSRGRRRAGDQVAWFSARTTTDAVIADEVASLLDDDVETPLIVVIDDAHHVTDDDVLARLCSAAVRHHRLHLVLCTRRPHPIRDHATDCGLEWAELTGKDLHARPGELAEIARAWGHDIDADREADLLRTTAGWIAPARRALDESDPEHDPTGQLAAERYVCDEVLPREAGQALMTAALAVSVPDELTVDLVRALTLNTPHLFEQMEETSVEGLLRGLEHQSLLDPVPSSDAVAAWRMPALVRNVLSKLFDERHPSHAAQTHAVIARALARHPDPRRHGRMIRHARAAEDWKLLARSWTHHGLLLASMHPEDTLVAYEEIPARELWRHAPLAIAASVVAALRTHGDPHRRATMMRNYANAAMAPRPEGRLSRPASDTMEVAAQMLADRLDGYPDQALRRARDHEERLLVAGEAQPPAATRAWFQFQGGLSAIALGEGGEALQLLDEAVLSARGAGLDFVVAAASSQLALIAATAGQGAQALRHLRAYRDVDMAGQWLHQASAPAARVATGMLALDRLDPGAIRQLDAAGDGTDSVEEWAVLTWVRAQHALLFGDALAELGHVSFVARSHQGLTRPGSRDQLFLDRTFAELLLATGELNRAERHLEGASAQDALFAVPRARLALITGEFHQARTTALDHVWRERATLRDGADLFMIEAVAALAMGDETAAAEAFTRGHGLASRMDSLIPYAHIPRDSLERLIALGGVEVGARDLELVRSVREVYPARGEVVRLTPREKAVLHAMVDNETLADVAAELTVSLNTVKKQSSSIYGKLGVHHRAAALVEAHRLGLLAEPTP